MLRHHLIFKQTHLFVCLLQERDRHYNITRTNILLYSTCVLLEFEEKTLSMTCKFQPPIKCLNDYYQKERFNVEIFFKRLRAWWHKYSTWDDLVWMFFHPIDAWHKNSQNYVERLYNSKYVFVERLKWHLKHREDVTWIREWINFNPIILHMFSKLFIAENESIRLLCACK